MKKYILLSAALLLHLCFFANTAASNDSIANSIVNHIKEKYSPKSGEGILKLTIDQRNDSVFILGSTTSVLAFDRLEEKLETTNYINKVRLLPDTTTLADKLYGIINVSVADIRTQNRYTSGMATQSLLGTPVKLLDKDGWYLIQMSDTYYGWATERQVVPMNKEEYNQWVAAPKVIFTKHYGFSYSKPDKNSEVVSDLVSGNVLKLINTDKHYFRVMYPDKRIAYIAKNEAQDFAEWLTSRKPSPQSFLDVAESLKGIPYVWGGTSSKGVDCSGLVSLVMKLHGLSILRDASQQATLGIPIDISNGYTNLQPGDLMFFGKIDREKGSENIRHVGFYLGDNKFLHASGYNRISSLDPNDTDYDDLNTKEFVKATRIADKDGLYGVWQISDSKFYQIQK